MLHDTYLIQPIFPHLQDLRPISRGTEKQRRKSLAATEPQICVRTAFRMAGRNIRGAKYGKSTKGPRIMRCSWGSGPTRWRAKCCWMLFELLESFRSEKHIKTRFSSKPPAPSLPQAGGGKPIYPEEEGGGEEHLCGFMINRVKVRRGDTFGSLHLNGEREVFSTETTTETQTSNEVKTWARVHTVRQLDQNLPHKISARNWNAAPLWTFPTIWNHARTFSHVLNKSSFHSNTFNTKPLVRPCC